MRAVKQGVPRRVCNGGRGLRASDEKSTVNRSRPARGLLPRRPQATARGLQISNHRFSNGMVKPSHPRSEKTNSLPLSSSKIKPAAQKRNKTRTLRQQRNKTQTRRCLRPGTSVQTRGRGTYRFSNLQRMPNCRHPNVQRTQALQDLRFLLQTLLRTIQILKRTT